MRFPRTAQLREHTEALLAADAHWIDLSRRVSRSPLVMHPEPGAERRAASTKYNPCSAASDQALGELGAVRMAGRSSAAALRVVSLEVWARTAAWTSAVDTAPAQ